MMNRDIIAVEADSAPLSAPPPPPLTSVQVFPLLLLSSPLQQVKVMFDSFNFFFASAHFDFRPQPRNMKSLPSSVREEHTGLV